MPRGLHTYHGDQILEAFFGTSQGTDPIDPSQVRTKSITQPASQADPHLQEKAAIEYGPSILTERKQ